jgi:signal recognition particle subunit SRP54
VKHVTGAPIRFVGVGEKLENLEEFHPERVAGRILGMGDVVSLVEKAREQVSDADAEKLSDKLAKGEMTMEDFLGQLKTLRRMGPLKHLMGLLPGVGAALKDVHIDDKQLDRVEAIVNSMTKKERNSPSMIDLSRRKRIAGGSGTNVEEVGQLVKQFLQMNDLTKRMASMSAMEKVKAVKDMGKSGMDNMLPGVAGMPQFRTKGSSHQESIKTRFKKRR